MKIIFTTDITLESFQQYETKIDQTPIDLIKSILQEEGYDSCPCFVKLYPSIYQVTEAENLKLETEQELDYINTLDPEETLILTLFPQDPTTIFLIISIIIVTAIYLMIPDVPATITTSGTISQASPNTELSNRVNSARLNGRIPDILGKVYSIPDLLMPAYKIYVDNQEVELAYMCIGRHHYLIEDVSDDTTLVSDIEGASAEIYLPYESKWQEDTPATLIGDAIPDPVRAVKRITAVNGQKVQFGKASEETRTIAYTLHGKELWTNGWNWMDVSEQSEVLHFIFDSPSYAAWSDKDYDTGWASPGVANAGKWLSCANYPAGGNPNFPISGSVVHISRPLAVEPPESITVRTKISSISTNPVGLLLNFAASGGLYRTSGTDIIETSHWIEVKIVSLTTSDEQIYTKQMVGDSNNSIGKTFFISPVLDFPIEVSCSIVSSTDSSSRVTSHNDIKWKDLYVYEDVTAPDQRSITTIYTRTPATEGALSVKNRKLNCIATSKFPQWTGSEFTTELYPTSHAIDCLAAISFDSYIGNQLITALDITGLYAEYTAVIDYFDTASAGEINITLDNIDMSYEETVQVIAQAVFCSAYRRGNQLQFSLEKLKDIPAELPVLLLASDNTLPNSLKFSTKLGFEYEGTSIEYIDQTTGDTKTLYTPEENLRLYYKVAMKGLNYEQALWHCWRSWNKIRYEFLSFECTATEEASLLRRMDKIYVADTTKLTTDSGRAMNLVGLTLTVDNPISLASGYIFLQMSDLLLQSIAFTKVDDYNLLLAETPRLPLSLDVNNAVQTLYSLTDASSPELTLREFLIQEKSGSTLFEWNVKGVNYDGRYYSQDGLLSTPPVVTLIGANPQILQQHDSYVDLGATAVDEFDNPLDVTADPISIDTSVVRAYQILYSATDANDQTTTVGRLVLIEGDVIITTPPVITILGDNPKDIPYTHVYTDAGATAVDAETNPVDVDTLFPPIDINTLGEQYLTYSATDQWLNNSIDLRLVTVRPLPVITILGINPLSIPQDTVYTDAGATAVDWDDNPISVDVVDNVDTSTLGSYTVDYTATDSIGGVTEAYRDVEVIRNYLIFGTI